MGYTADELKSRQDASDRAADAAALQISKRSGELGRPLSSQEKLTIIDAAQQAAGLESHYADKIPGLWEESRAFFVTYYRSTFVDVPAEAITAVATTAAAPFRALAGFQLPALPTGKLAIALVAAAVVAVVVLNPGLLTAVAKKK